MKEVRTAETPKSVGPDGVPEEWNSNTSGTANKLRPIVPGRAKPRCIRRSILPEHCDQHLRRFHGFE